MENANKEFEDADWLKDIPASAENIAFRQEEMIACGKCARMNPPVRLKCFYCATDLEMSDEQAVNLQPKLRRLEDWEKGFNLIFEPNANGETILDAAGAAKILRLEIAVLQKIVAVQKKLPLARIESEKEAEIVAKQLFEKGLNTFIVGDEKLAADVLPTRLRGLEFGDEQISLVVFNTNEIREIRREDLILIVSGSVFERKTESVEKRKKGESKILDASETASDESLLDIYSRSDVSGYRISAKGFDFSSLETEKSMLAAENMKKLFAKLGEYAVRAHTDNDYLKVREILGNVWEIENRKDAQGLKRHGFGKLNFSNISTSNNLRQFTRYSRLQREIL